jgi:hypothetical protein
MIPEKCEAVFGKDHTQKSYLYSRTFFTRDDSAS